jgi:hypothetical protein
MPDTTNGDGSAFNFDRKLDRINATLATMAVLMQEHMKAVRKGHQLFMGEVHELIALQKEQRIDLMAFFGGNPSWRDR